MHMSLLHIDSFSNYLLGCSHGFMRIHRHDGLVSILHALLHDPGVLKEQCASFDDNSHPGDCFHLIINMIVLPILITALLSPLIFPPLLVQWEAAAAGEVAN